MSLAENKYQAELIKKIEKNFPGCFVTKNDSSLTQGIPDLLILFGFRWAMLEVKVSENAPTQPNQEYYVALFNAMSYCSFIYPEIEQKVFYELQRALGN
jgi:hypothetical protein